MGNFPCSLLCASNHVQNWPSLDYILRNDTHESWVAASAIHCRSSTSINTVENMRLDLMNKLLQLSWYIPEKQARKSSEDTQVAGFARLIKFGSKKFWPKLFFIDFLAELNNFKKIKFQFCSSSSVSFCLVFQAFWQINLSASWPTVPSPLPRCKI